MGEITDKSPKLFTGVRQANGGAGAQGQAHPAEEEEHLLALCGQAEEALTKLKQEMVISGPLGSEWASGWICNPVIKGKKWDQNKIRVNLDTRSIKDIQVLRNSQLRKR